MTMGQKVKYLLHRFKNTEWSGPAWYKIQKKTKEGFPIKVRLEYFEPIDLGSGADTELDGELLGKMLPKILKKKPELAPCYLGLIHSHHTMGAFFSGTDKDTLLEQATTQGLYFSTVVASEKTKCVTAVSYRDQYGFSNMIEGEVKTVHNFKTEPEWRYQADRIEKKKKKEAKNTWQGHNFGYNYGYGRGYGHDQYNVFGGVDKVEVDKEETQPAVIKDGQVTPIELLGAGVTPEHTDKIAELYNKFESNEITEQEFVDKVREIDPTTEPHWYVDNL